MLLTPAPNDEEDKARDRARAAAHDASAGEIRKVLDEYFARVGHGAESATGHQLERARLGIVSGADEWGALQRSDIHHARLGLLRMLWDAIPVLPRILVLLQLVPNGMKNRYRRCRESELQTWHDVYVRQGGECWETLQGGGLCKRPLARQKMTCAGHLDRPQIAGTRQGETLVRFCKPNDFPPGEDFEKGWILVTKKIPTFPGYKTIADALSAEWDDFMARTEGTFEFEDVRERRFSEAETEDKDTLRNIREALEQTASTAQTARELLDAAQRTVEWARVQLLPEREPKRSRFAEDGLVDVRRVKYAIESAYNALRQSPHLALLLPDRPRDEVSDFTPLPPAVHYEDRTAQIAALEAECATQLDNLPRPRRPRGG